MRGTGYILIPKKVGMTEHFSKPLAMEKVIEAIGNYSKKITKI